MFKIGKILLLALYASTTQAAVQLVGKELGQPCVQHGVNFAKTTKDTLAAPNLQPYGRWQRLFVACAYNTRHKSYSLFWSQQGADAVFDNYRDYQGIQWYYCDPAVCMLDNNGMVEHLEFMSQQAESFHAAIQENQADPYLAELSGQRTQLIEDAFDAYINPEAF
jgi:hypothetical protein